jgi:hypothetical protein
MISQRPSNAPGICNADPVDALTLACLRFQCDGLEVRMTPEEATEIAEQFKDARRRYNQILDGWGSGITDRDQLEYIKAELDGAHESILSVLCEHQDLI